MNGTVVGLSAALGVVAVAAGVILVLHLRRKRAASPQQTVNMQQCWGEASPASSSPNPDEEVVPIGDELQNAASPRMEEVATAILQGDFNAAGQLLSSHPPSVLGNALRHILGTLEEKRPYGMSVATLALSNIMCDDLTRESIRQPPMLNDPETVSTIALPPTYPVPSMSLPNTPVREEVKHPLSIPSPLSPVNLKPRQATILVAEMEIAPLTDESTMEQAVGIFVRAAMETCEEFDGYLLQVEALRITISWNAHSSHPTHSAAACSCALQLRDTLINNHESLGCVAWWGIGVATGSVSVGTLGSKKGVTPLALGGCLPMIGRLCKLTRYLRVSIVVTDRVYSSVRGMVDARPIDNVKFHDIPEIIGVYELVGPQENISPRRAYIEAFSSLSHLRLREAAQKLEEHLSVHPGDFQAQRLQRVVLALEKKKETVGEAYARQETVNHFEEIEGPEDSTDDDDLQSSSTESLDSPRRIRASTLRDSSSSSSLSSLTSSQRRRTREQLQMLKVEFNKHLSAKGSGLGSPRSGTVPSTLKDQYGRYWFRSEKMLGKGAFGEVWLGMGVNGNLVALKTLRFPDSPLDTALVPTSSSSSTISTLNTTGGSPGCSPLPPRRLPRRRLRAMRETTVEDLLHEIGLLCEMRHDNIVGYLGSAVVAPYVVIIMENLSGGSLNDVLNNFGTLPLSSVRKYTQDILRGLAFLHEHDVVHRDLKPHNVLMNIEGDCKLADFGAAALLTEMATKNTTNTRIPVGTPLYMSVEACQGIIEKPSDVWAVGIIMCQLLTGRVPYDIEDYNPHSFLFRMKSEGISPEIPETTFENRDAIDVVKRCLNPDPNSRDTAADLLMSPFLIA